MAAGKILVIGKTHYDSVLNPVSGSFVRTPGASGYFAAVSASFLSRPTLITKVGCDFSKEHIDQIARMGVDASQIQRLDTPSIVWKARYVGPSTYETLGWENREVTDAEIRELPEGLKEIPGFAYIGEMAPSIQSALLDRLGKCRTLVDTKRPWVRNHPEELKEAVRKASMSVMNEEEAGELFGLQDPVEMAGAVRELGPDIAIVNLGEKGSLMDDGRLFRISEAICKAPVDTTGAGDTFSGSFVAALGSGITPEEAFLTASVMSSFVVEDFGINRMMRLNLGEIEERVAQAKSSGILVQLR